MRNAFFSITNLSLGEDQFLNGEDFIDSFEITTPLVQGDYQITLFDGWQMEQLGGSGGTGGFAGGPIEGPVGGGRPIGTKPLPDLPPVIIDEGSAGEPAGGAPDPGTGPSRGGFPSKGGAGGAAGSAGSTPAGGVTSLGGKSGLGGTAAGGVSTGGSPGTGTPVEALLVSSATQFFNVVARQDAFVNFEFIVGKDVIRTNPGTLHVGISVQEQCVRPPGSLDPNRVLLEHNRDAMQQVAIRDVFAAIGTNDGRAGDPVRLYQEIIDSFASAPNGRLADAIHCGDETANGRPALNGFPLECDRNEASQINNIDTWKPLAFVNRVDLAPQNGAHCGQQRMVFGTNAVNRMFMIFEAQIPNPTPELGAKGCIPVAEFWNQANAMNDAKARGARLADAFLRGDPGLVAQGFGPFMTATNFTVGSGQIRTNSFDSGPWTLREFKLAIEDARLKAIPFPVAEAPNGDLWDDRITLAQGPSCRESFVQAVQGLLVDNASDMSFIVDQACKDAESQNSGSQAYPSRMSPGFRQVLQDNFASSGLSPEQIAARAQFAGSCIGCHEEAIGSFLGNGVVAPFSNGFTHIDEFDVPCPSETGTCSNISPALTDVFLPRRLEIFGGLLGVVVPPDPCNSGTGGGTGTGGSTGIGGISGEGGDLGEGGGVIVPPPLGGSTGGPALPPPIITEPGPAPVIDIQLPSAETPVEQLQAEDAAIREAFGDKTLGSRDARVTH